MYLRVYVSMYLLTYLNTELPAPRPRVPASALPKRLRVHSSPSVSGQSVRFPDVWSDYEHLVTSQSSLQATVSLCNSKDSSFSS